MTYRALTPVVMLIGLTEVVVAVITGSLRPATAQACEAMSSGPERTDCFIGRARVAGAKSNAVAAAARQGGAAATLANKTGAARRVKRGTRQRAR
jgi:hypothetical protein